MDKLAYNVRKRNTINTILSQSVRGSSIVEAVTASIIFIIVFVISVQTVVNISSLKFSSCRYVAADIYCREILDAYISEKHIPGKYVHDLENGTIEVNISEYEHFAPIYKVDVRFISTNGKTIIKQIYLIDYEQLCTQ